MTITIECYGASARWCGGAKIALELAADGTVDDALSVLAQRYPEFASRRASVAVAIGDAIVKPSQRLPDGALIALIPPVSAG
ncbi:MAG: MoaD/ThiS family protein [Nevskia sp.]|jgi:molybdopterin converting factor small subunit|nr:MoaD/ThiS family protein [Nevskia sp.]